MLVLKAKFLDIYRPSFSKLVNFSRQNPKFKHQIFQGNIYFAMFASYAGYKEYKQNTEQHNT